MKINDLLISNPDFGLFDAAGTSIFTAAELKEQIAAMIFILSFEKEMGDLGPARDETKEIDLYYKEREWRLVPSTLTVVSGAAKLRAETGTYFYLFDRNDVNMIVVPNDEVRTVVLKYFLSLGNSTDDRLKSFAENPLPVINYDDLHRW